MPILKSIPAFRQRVRILLTPWGYAVQVYGQTVMRSTSHHEALRLATGLERAIC